jgi:anion-transporting  ArsA/GET3 family ATPase
LSRLTILCGGGGVGKTSTAAALGIELARRGEKTLVVTIDPARRLADALGITIGNEVCQVKLDGVPEGRLFVRMPEGRALADDFVAWLFEAPEVRERIRQNAAYHELADAMVGTTELFAISLIERDLQSGEYDHVVLDTAPSRHALYFLTYPKQLLDLLDARALKWIADLAAPKEGAKKGGFFAWGREKVEALFSRAIGHDAVVSIASLLAEVVHVRKRWAGVIRSGYERMLKGTARFVLVGAPTGAAVDDVQYLDARLRKLGPRPAAIVLNRADARPPSLIDQVAATLDEHSPAHGPLRRALQKLRDDFERRSGAASAAETRLRASAGKHVPLVRLPMIVAPEPVDVVLGLSSQLASLADAVTT